MKALRLTAVKKLVIKEIGTPEPAEGEVRVKLEAAALNHRELWISKGLYPGMTLPCTLGADGTGIIDQLGEGVDKVMMGREVIIYPAYDWGSEEDTASRKFRVLGMPDPGTIAQYITVPVSNVLDKPAYLTWEEAAAMPIAGLTAWRALSKHGQLKKGKKVLITGIGGGVAQAGLAIAKAMGAQIHVTSSSAEKIILAKEQGAISGVNYKEADWNLQLKEQSGGIDIVLDSSPSVDLDSYLKFMNYGGRIVYYGSTGSPKTTLSISKFFLRHIHFIGSTMGSPKDFRDMLNFMTEYRILPKVHEVFPFEKTIEALELLATGEQVGKIVIKI